MKELHKNKCDKTIFGIVAVTLFINSLDSIIQIAQK